MYCTLWNKIVNKIYSTIIPSYFFHKFWDIRLEDENLEYIYRNISLCLEDRQSTLINFNTVNKLD